MRILVISQFYSPDITAAAFRIKETVDLLKEAGHDVRVITAEPHKSTFEVDHTLDKLEKVHRVRVEGVGSGGIRNYLVHYFSFVIRSFIVGVRQQLGSWKPQVIWASSPPLFVGITGHALARMNGCPWVLDVRDVWPQSAVVAGQISENGNAFKGGRILERRLYGAADHITCVSGSMADYIRTQCLTPADVVYNGVLASTISPSGVSEATEKCLVYAGNFGRVQGLEFIIDAFAQATQDNQLRDWRLKLVGGGALEGEIRNQVTRHRLAKSVVICPPMPKHAVFKEFARAAALVINLKPDRVFDLTIPSKVFDYMSANRPILFGIRGEGADILNSTGGNVAFEPSDPASFLIALARLDTEYSSIGFRALTNSAVVGGIYSRERAVDRLIDVFDRLAGKQ